MNYTKSFLAVVILGLGLASGVGCTKGSTDSAPTSCSNATIGAAAGLITTTNTNSIPVYVADTTTTGSIGYPNEPLVSVTICSPNHTLASQCQTISNILLDTGSFGLRVFGSAIASNVALQPQTVSVQGQAAQLGECMVFGIGADWGSVANGDVLLGNQTALNIPIQVINIGFSAIPQVCAQLGPDTDPCTAGYNGIMGVGMFTYDCGADCASADPNTNPGNYFACNGNGCGNEYTGSCVGGSGGVCAVTVGTGQQVVNPIFGLATGFNNGITLALPSLGNPLTSTGASGVSGLMTMGIGTTAGNVPGTSVVVYQADPNGMIDGEGSDFLTTANGTTYGTGSTQSFLDSGSNGIFFPSFGAFNQCSDSAFFCPGVTSALNATIKGISGSPSFSFTGDIANADTLFSTGNSAYNNLGGSVGGSFAWGLPFFYGRPVFVGIDGQTANFNTGSVPSTPTGPYWGF